MKHHVEFCCTPCFQGLFLSLFFCLSVLSVCLFGCSALCFCLTLCLWLISPPENYLFGRTSVLQWFISFFSPHNLRAPSADRRKILHDARCCVQFYNPGPKFLGSLPKKFLGPKNMQNLARFRLTSKFGGKYLQKG